MTVCNNKGYTKEILDFAAFRTATNMEVIQVNVEAMDIFPKFVSLGNVTNTKVMGNAVSHEHETQTDNFGFQSTAFVRAAEEKKTSNNSLVSLPTITASSKYVRDAERTTKSKNRHEHNSQQLLSKHNNKYTAILQIELRERIYIWQLLEGEDHQTLRQVCLPFKHEIDTFIGLPVVYNEDNYKKLGPIPPASYMRLTMAIVGNHLQKSLKQSQLLTQITLDGPIRQHLFTLLLIKSPNLQILKVTKAFKMDPPSNKGSLKTKKLVKNSLNHPDVWFNSSSNHKKLFMKKLQHLQIDGTEEIKFNRFFTILNIKDILTHCKFPALQTFEINFFFAQSTEIYELVKLVCNCIVEYRQTLKHLSVALREGTDARTRNTLDEYQKQPQQDYTQNSSRNIQNFKLGQKQRDFKSLSLKTLKVYVDHTISLPFYILARAQNNLNVYEQMKTQTTWSHHIPILLRNHETLHTVRIYAAEPIVNLGAFVNCTNLKILHISRHFSAHNNFNYTYMRSLQRPIRIGEIIRMYELPVSIRQLYLLGYNIESDEIIAIAEKLVYLEVLDIQLPGFSSNLNSGTKYKLGLFPNTLQKILTLRYLNTLILEDYVNEFNDTFEFICQIIPKISLIPDRFLLPSNPRRLYIIIIMDRPPTSSTSHMDYKNYKPEKDHATTSWHERYTAYL